jgi:MoaA/NifB/PqqE/SkfB family radical SAM enzyme
VANLREVRALGLRVKLNSPLTIWNEREIGAMFALADELGVPMQFDPQITRRDDGDAGPLDVAPSRGGVARLVRLQQERAGASRQESLPADMVVAAEPTAIPAKHCGAGSSSITVDPFGNVYPCVQWRRALGNLHDDSILALWNHSAELTEIRRLAGEVTLSLESRNASGIGFCPGLAEQQAGHATHLYPIARLLLELREHGPVA